MIKHSEICAKQEKNWLGGIYCVHEEEMCSNEIIQTNTTSCDLTERVQRMLEHVDSSTS